MFHLKQIRVAPGITQACSNKHDKYHKPSCITTHMTINKAKFNKQYTYIMYI